MKKQIKIAGIFMLMFASIAFSALSQREGRKGDKKEYKEKHGKNKEMHDKDGKHDGKWDKKENDGENDREKDKYKDKYKDKHGNNGHPMYVTYGSWDGFTWNRVNFKQRMQIKNQQKVTICHHFNNSNKPNVTINVSPNAVQAHMKHGDNMGECRIVKSQYSDIYLRKRTEYYNNLQNAREQVAYSQSMLDYARARLAQSRLELAVMQKNKVPPATIERKQAAVVQLETNTTLLGTLIGVAANVIVK